MDRLMLLDSASLYFRAFFGLPDSLRSPDGTVVNALRGMLDYTATLAERYSPDRVVACWDDDWRPQWRVDLIDSYKTHRVVEVVDLGPDVEEVPDLLSPQVPLIAEAFGLLGIDVVGAPAAEADDVIGTHAAHWAGPVDAVTGDRDLFQVVDDARQVRVLYTGKGVAKLDEVDDSWLVERYGVRAAQYVDYAVLRGDASDGLPGVRGIGEKTAAALLQQHGDLAGIAVAAADPATTFRPAVRAALLDAADYIAAAQQVVTVRGDLEVPEPTPLGAIDVAAARSFAARWGAESAMDRAIAALTVA